MALLLRAKGIARVRPLLGGYEAWVALGYPIDGPGPGAEPLPGAAPPQPVR